MEKNKSEWMNAKNVAVFLFGVVLMYLLTNVLVSKRFQEIENSMRVQVEEQEALIAVIAETTSRNGADAIIESIVRDCALNERSRFEDLLNQLNDGLSYSNLVELEQLFGRCGTFFSERKAVMVSRLSREIEVYDSYVGQLSSVVGEDLSDSYMTDQWKLLADEEKKQSELFAKLVLLQGNIINELLKGKTATSEEIVNILQEVSEVNQTLTVARIQARNIRSNLVSL